MTGSGLPPAQGLYDPRHEHDACGQGFVVNIKGHKSHRVLEQAIQVLKNLDHRGACGCEVNTGDGAGVLLQMPQAFNEEVCRKARIPLPAAGQRRRPTRPWIVVGLIVLVGLGTVAAIGLSGPTLDSASDLPDTTPAPARPAGAAGAAPTPAPAGSSAAGATK